MAGWGRCRNCGSKIWWGANPFDADRVWPFDDDEEEQPHFETCSATEWVTDVDGSQHRVSACKACGARVWWETTIRGKRRPMDVDGERCSDTCHFDSCTGEPVGARARRRTDRREAGKPTDVPYVVRLWLPDLGLSWPTTPAEVTTAFRRLALIHHPDMGGQASDFIRIKLAYDRLKQLLGEQVAV